MNPAANQLLRRVIGWQILFAAGTTLIMGAGAQHLLLLTGSIGLEGAWQAAMSIAIGAALGTSYSAWLLNARRFTLRYIDMGSGLSDTKDLQQLTEDPRRIAWSWFVPITLCLLIATTLARPVGMDINTGFTLFLLGSVIVAATSLPLMVLVRAACLRALELAPAELMGQVVKTAEDSGQIRRTWRLPRRLVAAVTTPVLIVALGSALIANAHVRRNDERNREESAGALARSVLEPESGASTSGAGLNAASIAAERLGFSAQLSHKPDNYRAERMAGGLVELTTPLDAGSAQVRFSGSTVAVLSADLMAIACLAVFIAGTLGIWLGRVLIYDLRLVTRSVRALGTEAVIRGTRPLRPARFLVVAQLALAIDRLAARFRVFARAQERAIQARQTASRARGMFFASVSHDLKSPLNAILGFTELVRLREDISPGQSESLELIQRRGRELLALIETILDAARVEAGQLTLNTVPYSVAELVRQATAKANDLSAEVDARTLQDVTDCGNVLVDPDRMPGALATFIAHGIRTAAKQDQRIRAFRSADSCVQFEIEVPTTTATAEQLEAMLDPTRQPGAGQHRGLALGLRLARSIVELHKGSVSVKTYERGLLYVVKLPGAPEELRSSGANRAVLNPDASTTL